MDESRPNPDQLLQQINHWEVKNTRGKLKIFFGYAAGVGKTYAMLDAAHVALKAGVDVVVGYVEPHTRPETMALLEGLEVLPTLDIAYKGITLKEFDLDAALQRNPQLILVDELAHTNAKGCRHTKRYGDIEELLQAGINVYTTVNVQHLESLHDIVSSITQVSVKERIPDSVFDSASQVELVDIEPEELIERLQQGKIYKEQQAQKALHHFFTPENLVSLREIALRRTADRVNQTIEAKTKTYTGEHILICLSSSPSNAKVIRTAARMAKAFHAAFTALFVEMPSTKELDKEDKVRLLENLKLAKQLGAKIVTVYGEDVSYQISEYAKASGVSKIVMGRSNNKTGFFHTKPSLVEKVTALAPQLDVHIIPDITPLYNKKEKKRGPVSPTFHWINLIKIMGMMLLCTFIGLVLYRFGFHEANIITIYILGVLLIANQIEGKIYGIASSIIAVLTYNFFFTEPRFTLHAVGAEYPFTFLIMLFASLITSTLTMQVKNQAKQAAQKAHRTEILLETSQKLLRAKNMEEIIQQASSQLLQLLDKTIILYLAENTTLLSPRLFPCATEKRDLTPYIQSDEQAVAFWVFKNKKAAGITTDTLPGAKAFYLPVSSHEKVLAVLGVILTPGEDMEPFEHSLLLAMLNEIAFAIEKYKLNENQKQISMQAERERLRANLLRAISHDLRTPLTSISGNASILLNNEENVAPKLRKDLYEDIYDDALWLINLVENLLSVTRIDDGSIHLAQQPELVEEMITEALRHIHRKQTEHHIQVQLEDHLLMVKVDARLIIQVIINMVNNAIMYTDQGSTIIITANKQKQKALIEIADNGNGISAQHKEQLFDMFFTAPHNKADNRRGIGLGLSLCKSIIKAHGGEIYVKDNIPRGTIFGFTLPLEEI